MGQIRPSTNKLAGALVYNNQLIVTGSIYYGPSGDQPDSVWSATGGPGSTWGYMRTAGQNTYINGMVKTKDIYIRFQLFWTSNWAWPGDPKTEKYNWGASPCYDNKILYVYPPEAVDNPAGSAYDAGVLTSCGTYDPASNSRFSDALVFRVGDAGENYRTFPLCSQCSGTSPHNEYGPFVTSPAAESVASPRRSARYSGSIRAAGTRWSSATS